MVSKRQGMAAVGNARLSGAFCVGYSRLYGHPDLPAKRAKLKAAGCTKIVFERSPSSSTMRDQIYRRLSRQVPTRPAYLVICSLYDLSVRLKDLVETLQAFHECGIEVVVLDEGWTGTPQQATLRTFIGNLAEYSFAPADGGKHKIMTIAEAEKMAQRADAGEPINEIAASLSISRITVWRYIKAARLARQRAFKKRRQ